MAAFTFELSKVERPAIRSRMVAHLLNVDEDLAGSVARGLRLQDMPEAADAAMPTRMDLAVSPKLSILLNGPENFKGRKLGVLVTDGADIGLLKALKSTVESEGAAIEFVAPMIGGVEASDSTWIEAKQAIDGGPSVLYDAVAIVAPEEGVETLAKLPPAKDFVNDAFAHCKFVGFSGPVRALFDKIGLASLVDGGCVELTSPEEAGRFVKQCGKLRFWDREPRLTA